MTQSKQTALELVLRHGTRCPFAICAAMDIQVLEYEMTENIDGFYAIIKNRPVIYIDSGLERQRKVQVAAHELGHLLLHGDKNLLFLSSYTLFVPSRYEREADSFAAYLLTERELLESYSESTVSSEHLCAICGISSPMAQIIAEDTDYFTDERGDFQ